MTVRFQDFYEKWRKRSAPAWCTKKGKISFPRFFYDSGLELRKCHSSLNTAVNTKTTMYLEGPEMAPIELPPFRQRPPQFASKQSREGGHHHAGRVTRALRRKIPEKAVKKTPISTPPLAAICAGKQTAECLPF